MLSITTGRVADTLVEMFGRGRVSYKVLSDYGTQCVSFANVYHFLSVSSPFWFSGGMWYFIVSILDRRLSVDSAYKGRVGLLCGDPKQSPRTFINCSFIQILSD